MENTIAFKESGVKKRRANKVMFTLMVISVISVVLLNVVSYFVSI